MGQVIGIVIGIAAVAAFVWLLIGSKKSSESQLLIDPNDPRQIGTLIGMMGGSVADGALAQFALRRFEQEHGRKATVKDMGIVAGMMKTGR